MTSQTPEPTNAPSAAREHDQGELVQDLELKDADAADAVKGGRTGAGAGKITFNPFTITK